MTAISLDQTASITAEKLHIYLRLAGTAIATYTIANVEAAIGTSGDSVYLKNVETGIAVEEAIGNTIINTLGQTITLDVNLTGSMNVLGLTAEDMTALKEGGATDKVHNENVDVFFVSAPLSRTAGTVLAGDRIYCVYNVKATVTFSFGDGQPAKCTITFDATTAANTSSIKVGDVVAT